MKKLAVLLLAAGIAAGLLGCSKSSPTTTTVTVAQSGWVAANVYLSRYSGSNLRFDEYVDIYSDPLADPALCSAQMKFGSTSFGLRQATGWGYGYGYPISFYDTLPCPYPVASCSVLVTTNVGSSRAGVSFPGSYQLTAPWPRGDTLPWGALSVAWTQAQYASWYQVVVYYSAYDTNYIGSGDTMLFLTGTSATFPQAFFQKYPNTRYISGDAEVYAYGGPMPVPGAAGNMAGDFNGFFFSGFSDSLSSSYFYMGTPGPIVGAQAPSHRISQEKRREAILKAFGAPMKSEEK